uniref:Uncharacterized protein n=1 Tax=Theropithecus gelada TaxID=9565 RepID=A0A8D2EBE3_THEGE
MIQVRNVIVVESAQILSVWKCSFGPPSSKQNNHHEEKVQEWSWPCERRRSPICCGPLHRIHQGLATSR